ncbi:SH3 domain-containing protein [Ensifer sp. ENS06]|uniref:SH3 domain-containing protein n=1 Tax=Ensifer sp. ENS06 TaxID=2769276 RepID=UPI00177A9138|nr:SH3 domain-containing protein [Ensifer sp. ENS06]MBD9628157.1 SH3 domain-containing protein [Ensifer sp. ENS06]
MRRLLIGAAVIVTLVYLLGSIGAERTTLNETRRPSARIVAQDQKPVAEGGTQVSAVAPQHGQSPESAESVGTEKVIATVFVRGKRVALRERPGKEFAILDRYDAGRPVGLLSVVGAWSRVKDNLTRREGWIASHLLSSDKPRSKPKRDTPASVEPSREEPVKVPRISDALIVQRIIAESISGYSGSCPCPENRDRAGRRCGRRSAYSKPGGAAPICYPDDVSREMIEAFRARL